MPSPKILARKKKLVKQFADELKTAESLVFTDYKGLNVAQDTEMRAEFRKAGVVYRVVKNSVSSRALEAIGIGGLDEVLKGPTAIAYSTEDVTLAPRLVRGFVDKFKKMEVKGGILQGEVVDVETIRSLAAIPALPVLYTQLVSTLMFPVTRLAITLNLIAEKQAEGKEADTETEDAQAEVVAEAAPQEAAAPEAPAEEVAAAPEAAKASAEAVAEAAPQEAAAPEAPAEEAAAAPEAAEAPAETVVEVAPAEEVAEAAAAPAEAVAEVTPEAPTETVAEAESEPASVDQREEEAAPAVEDADA